MNILTHYQRIKSDPSRPLKNERTGEIIEFDNVNLYFVEVDLFGAGLILPKDRVPNTAKIKFEDFEKVTGYPFEAFEKAYFDTFFGREISVLCEMVYNRLVPRRVEFGENSYISFTKEAVEEFKKNQAKLITKDDSSIPF